MGALLPLLLSSALRIFKKSGRADRARENEGEKEEDDAGERKWWMGEYKKQELPIAGNGCC